MSIDIESICLHCRSRFRKAYEATSNGGMPEDGDKILCVVCGGWSMWDHGSNGNLRLPSKEEAEMISQSPGAMKAAVAMDRYRKTGRLDTE